MFIKLLAFICLTFSILNTASANPEQKSFGYYYLQSPNRGMEFFQNRQVIALFDRGHEAEPCSFGNEHVCIKSKSIDWLFTVPLRKDWQNGDFIKGTDIKMMKINIVRLQGSTTEIWTLERSSPAQNKLIYNYSPHFGLISFMLIGTEGSAAYISVASIGYGAIEPLPPEN